MTAIGTLALPSVQSLAQLGEAIHHGGLDRNLGDVRRLVRSARGLGIAPVLCQVALDPGAPAPVRERAIAALIRRVARVAELRVQETHPASTHAASTYQGKGA